MQLSKKVYNHMSKNTQNLRYKQVHEPNCKILSAGCSGLKNCHALNVTAYHYYLNMSFLNVYFLLQFQALVSHHFLHQQTSTMRTISKQKE